MDIAVLIGVDLWARTRQAIPPPPIRSPGRKQGVHRIDQDNNFPTEAVRLETFLEKELQKFREVRGPTNKTEHVIRVKTDVPIKQRYRPCNPAMQAIIDQEVEQMLREGIIEPSTSAWSSPIVIVRKRDGKYRFCIDFRKVNEVTERDAYPLPHISATLDKLAVPST